MDIIQRALARQMGLTRYYTGKPCIAGHLTERRTNDGVCLACKKVRDKQAQGNRKEKRKEHYKANREKLLAQKAADYLKHRERRLAGMRNIYAKDSASKIERQKVYYRANMEKVKDYQKQRYEEKRDAILESRAVYRANNPDINKAWRLANPDKAAQHDSTRRARKRNAVPDNRSPMCRQWEIQAHKTRLALNRLTGYEWHVDHMLPLSQGGPHTAFNLQVIPAVLNLKKKHRLVYTRPNEWRKDWKLDGHAVMLLDLLDKLPKK